MNKKTVTRLFAITLSLVTLMLSGCADLSYYMHSINGHYAIMDKTRTIKTVLADESTDPALTQRLQLVSDIRQFAIDKLHLPESDSYTLYADLERSYALKNMFAAEEFSVAAHRWCYPIVGCAGYRGYFDEEKMRAYRDELEQQGFDVYVANVSAYSTLGWFDDPVLNTFIDWPDYRLAGLIFHELAHQHVYIKGDSKFNESFAMAVQQLGVEYWLQTRGQAEKLNMYQQQLQNRQQVINLIEQGRDNLQQLYQLEIEDEQKRLQKEQLMQQLKQDYQKLAASFKVPDGFKRWFENDLNNAQLVSISTYYTQIPIFKKIMRYHQGDFKQFLGTVKKIHTLNPVERQLCLNNWQAYESKEVKIALKAEKNDTNLASCRA